MKKVKPIANFTQFQFECPKCGWPYWFTENQLSNKHFFFACDCGQGFKPDANIKIKEEEKENKHILKIPIKSDKFNIAVGVLKDQGYSKSEAKSRVEAIFNESKNIETLIMEAVLNVNFKT